jgi:hypothetical protein
LGRRFFNYVLYFQFCPKVCIHTESIGDTAMFRCPHCEKPAISPLRKAILSPGLLASCKSCSGLSGIRYPSWLTAMLPGSVLMIAALFVDSSSAEWSLNIMGLILMIVIPPLFTPLHRED